VGGRVLCGGAPSEAAGEGGVGGLVLVGGEDVTAGGGGVGTGDRRGDRRTAWVAGASARAGDLLRGVGDDLALFPPPPPLPPSPDDRPAMGVVRGEGVEVLPPSIRKQVSSSPSESSTIIDMVV
jgi:hypothetical protein